MAVPIQKVKAELQSVSKENEQVQKNRDLLSNEVKTLQERAAGFKNVNSVSEALLVKYGFTPSSVEVLLEVARKYQTPHQSLEAAAGYNTLQEINREIEIAQQRSSVLDSQGKQLEARIESLKEEEAEIKNTIQKTLLSLEKGLLSSSSKAAANISEMFQAEMDKLRLATDQYARNAADAAVLEEELRIARILQVVSKYPAELDHETSKRYAVLFLELAIKILDEAGINPKYQNSSTGVVDVLRLSLQPLNPSR